MLKEMTKRHFLETLDLIEKIQSSDNACSDMLQAAKSISVVALAIKNIAEGDHNTAMTLLKAEISLQEKKTQ